MTITAISTYGHRIALQFEESIPIRQLPNILKEVKDVVKENLIDNIKEGVVETYYTEIIENVNFNEEDIQVDVDCRWFVVDWESVADDLYNAWVEQKPDQMKKAIEKYKKLKEYR